MNQVILVGRLAHDPEITILDDGTQRTVVNLAISKTFKNKDGIYETDFIKIILWNGIASATKDYCHKGDVIGIKGRLQSRTYEDSEHIKKHILEVIADKVTFISSSQVKNA